MSDMPNWNATADAFRHDVHFALRGIRRRPAFTAMVVTTLSLGIGANATMFGILDRLLFQEANHWVLLLGSPGSGKSAVSAASDAVM